MFQCDIDKTLFVGMNPLEVGLFTGPEKSRPPRRKDNLNHRPPVIRIVFALASKEAGVLFPALRSANAITPMPSLHLIFGVQGYRQRHLDSSVTI